MFHVALVCAGLLVGQTAEFTQIAGRLDDL